MFNLNNDYSLLKRVGKSPTLFISIKYFFCFIFYFFSLFTFSQNVMKSKIIKGKVTTIDGVPISYVSIFNIKDKTGTQSDKNGEYLLIIKNPSIINFSLLGFQSVELNITQNMLSDLLKDSLTFNIVLKTAIKELKTVEITAENIKVVYDNSLLDYEFNNDNILLLISENKKSKLRLINSDSIIKDKILNFPAGNFFRDCFNNIQVLTKDSSYQAYILPSEIYIYKGVDLKQFNSLSSCVVSTPEHLFLQQFGPHNQSVIYSYINKHTKERKMLKHITSAESENFAKGEVKKIAQLKRKLGNKSVMDDLNATELGLARDIESRTWFYENILVKPTYNPLKQIRDSIFIFNHISDSVYVYNSNAELKRTFNIKYHYIKGWKNEIIIDETKQSAYAKFINDGIVYLCKINLDNGNILNQYKLEHNTFPEKIKIKDNYAYYLYIDNTEYFPKKRLYRQKLD